MKRKLLAMLGVTTMVAGIMTGCGSTTKGESAEGNGEQKQYEIGILQFAEHGSLDNCTEGFIQGLAQEGFVEGENVTFELKNASADMGITGQIAAKFGTDFKDLVCAVATPAAQTAYNAVMDRDIPVIYTAVTDPVIAELATEDNMPVGNVTGTSDALPVENQLKMIREILPEAKTIGIIYTTSEVNSKASIEVYESLIEEYGFELEVVGVSGTAEITMATESLLGKVDCITNLTDNTVVSALPTVLGIANEAGIPVFGSEIEQVEMGCIAAQGIDYIELGRQTGVMAAKVLRNDERAKNIPFEIIVESELSINTAAAANLEITISEDLTKEAKNIFDSVNL